MSVFPRSVLTHKSPLFSIVMPTHNSEQFVGAAIESVLAQSLSSWELLVVDDASVDDTVEILGGYQRQDPRVRVLVIESNVGPAKARNAAIAESCGRYVAFLDSDDLWREDKLLRQLGLFDESGTPLAYSAYEKIDESGGRVGRVVSVPETTSYRQLLGATVIATCTAAYDTERVGRVLMPDIRKRQDFGLWLKILRGGGVARAINEPVAFLRKRPGSVSSNKLSAASYTWKVYRELEKMSILDSAWCFARYALHASIKSRI